MHHQDVLSPDEEGLLELAVAIADGTPIDWAGSTPSNADTASTSVLVRLRCLERLVRGHEAVRTLPGRGIAASAQDTLLTEARRKTVLRPDLPLRVQWGPLIVYEKIGRGSFGDVYRARDPRLDREVALKLVPEDTTESVSSPVVEEGRLLARVRHPNVLAVYGAERIDGRVGIWTEYVRGETLADEIARRGPLSPDEATRIGIEVCRALGAVHEAGLLHRDVKAQNILRDATGRIVLGDFGTGIELDENAGVAEPQIAGTPLYLAPEIFENQAATVGSDLYSAGVLLYFLVTGNYPVRGRTFGEIRRAHATGQRVLLRDARTSLPATFVDIVEALLATGPDRRYGTAAAAERALGAWIAEPAEAESPQSPLPRAWLRTHRAATAAIGLLLASVVAIAVGVWRGPQRPAGSGAAESSPRLNVPADAAPAAAAAAFKLNPRDWILVGSFENRTGEAVLDGTIDAAVKREMEYSEFVTVAQRDRVEDALRLLDRPLDARLDRQLAREVSLSDGAIRAVLTGYTEKSGDGYAITSEILNPVDGGVVASLTDTPSRQSEMLITVRRQVHRIRQLLGEPLDSVERSRQVLKRSAPPALKALHLYSKAQATLNLRGPSDPNQWNGIEQLTREALHEDSTFAIAHAGMAYAIVNQRRPRQESLPYIERAFQLAETATPQERYFIVGSFHAMRGRGGRRNLEAPPTPDERRELEEAGSAYEALLALQPDHYSLLINLTNIYTLLHRDRDVASMTFRIADARPRNTSLNIDVATQLLQQGNFEAARRYAARAETGLPPKPTGADAQVRLFSAYAAWLQDDPREALKITDAKASVLGQFGAEERRQLGTRLVRFYIALGRLRQAERMLEVVRASAGSDPLSVFNAQVDDLIQAVLLVERAERDSLRDFAALKWRNPLESDASPYLAGRIEFLVEAGLLDLAERDSQWLTRQNTRLVASLHLSFAGAIELARGRLDSSILILERAVTAARLVRSGRTGSVGSQQGQYAAAKLAEAYEASGNLPKAIDTLMQSGKHRREVTIDNDAPRRWIHGRAQLARLYRNNGQDAEARTIEAHLLKLLALADSDYPLLVELRARR